MYHAGRDAARSYLEYATVIERTAWAQSLQAEVERLQALTAKQVKQIEEVRRGSKDAGANFDVQQNHPSLLGRARDWLRTHTA
jgi:hypothetical protein